MKRDVLALRAEEALKDVREGRCKVGRTPMDKEATIKRVEAMAESKQSFCCIQNRRGNNETREETN